MSSTVRLPRTTNEASAWTDHAHRYAEQGWYVVPLHVTQGKFADCSCGNRRCQAKGAHPRQEGWQAEKSCDPTAIDRWGQTWPKAHVGVATGLGSGIVAIRVTHHKLDEGGQRLVRILPPTLCFSAGESESVYIFAHPGLPLKPFELLTHGVTLVGDNGFIRVPPLPSEQNAPLKWEVAPGVDDPAPLPGFILQEIGITESQLAAASTQVADRGGLPFQCIHDSRDVAAWQRPWCIPSWIREGSVTVLLGAPKVSRKTTWLMQAVQAVVMGQRFLGRPVAVGPAVYLTDQLPGSFHRHVQGMALHRASELHVLFSDQVSDVAWPHIMAGAIRQCEQVGARMLAINGLEGFSKQHDLLTNPEVIDPLVTAATRGLAVVVAPTTDMGHVPLSHSVVALGRLASVADILLRIAPVTDQGHYQIEALSAFAETPAKSSIFLDRAGQFRMQAEIEQQTLFAVPTSQAVPVGVERLAVGA